MVGDDLLDTGSGSGAVVPSGAPLDRVRPMPPARRPWIQLTDAELERACKLAARGVDLPTIAAAMLLPEKRVARALRSRKGSHTVRWLRGRAILAEVEHEE